MERYEVPLLTAGAPIGLMPVECPRCGESAVSYCEDVEQFRRVLGVRGTRRLVIATEIEDEYDLDGSTPRLYCHACCYRWPVPGDVEWQP